MSLQQQYNALFPRFKTGIEGHCLLTDVTIECAKEIQGIVQPKNFLEIGFNAGHSAFMWLSLFPELKFHSVDICEHSYTLDHMKKLKEVFGDRFTYGKGDSKKLNRDFVGQFDLVFIDGDHTREGVTSDYELCRSAKTPWVLIDDYNNLRAPRNLCNHISSSENHPYTEIGKFKYDDATLKTVAVLFKRNDNETV